MITLSLMRIFTKNEMGLLFVMVITSFKCFSQVDTISQLPLRLNEEFVKFTGTIQLKDSQYLLITKLNVKMNDSIEVRKHRIFDQMQYPGIDGRLSLQKNIRSHFVNISVDAFKQYDIYDSTGKIPRTFIYENQPLTDTVPLGNVFPFEIGKYRILVELEYLYQNISYTATTGFIYFDAPFIPRSYIY